MLNTRDEQHTLSQPTRRRANTANGKEGLKHYLQGAPTGITFKAPLDFVRHLGIPLSPMLAHVATAALYDSKLKAICARVRHWSRYDLSLLGRAHVAKQVLASTLSYHATFLPPPPDTLAKI